MRSLHLVSRIHKTLNLKNNPNFTLTSSNFTRRFTSPSQESTPSPREPPPSTDRVTSIVDELSKLTLLEVSDLTEVLRTKLEIKEMPVMAVMMPGMGFSMGPGMKGGAVGGAAAAKAEEKVEKTVFDVKLEGFDAASKIKVIKEVRGFTDLGLKEAKDLVEKAPTLLKKGVTKDEAEKIVEKMKGVGAKVTME
ncbi:39S RIBOSOMAL PROTEIN L12 [Salix purpurea]|uniref:39S RIBOSOMAL PROTEIN L12 n=1 Tax=Salix purpurea TaxID=77065 RepID=A0A9Q0V0R0_SALPP|nr:39S RIBOSOMAL PROTEIN L12 [Salix purpurea]